MNFVIAVVYAIAEDVNLIVVYITDVIASVHIIITNMVLAIASVGFRISFTISVIAYMKDAITNPVFMDASVFFIEGAIFLIAGVETVSERVCLGMPLLMSSRCFGTSLYSISQDFREWIENQAERLLFLKGCMWRVKANCVVTGFSS